jgi:hypothetical protein
VTSHVDQDPVCPPFHAEGGGDTFTSAEELEQHAELVDWSQLTIISDPEQDGEPYVLADVETLFEAMGFKAADERVAQAIEEEIAIPVIPEDVLHDMNEAGVDVHDMSIQSQCWIGTGTTLRCQWVLYILAWLISDWQSGNIL